MPTRPPGTPDVDLTFDGAFGTIDGGSLINPVAGVFQTAGVQSAGTGVFNTFVRIQNTGTEQGYNTDAAAQYDEKSTFHHSVLLANIPIVIGDGTGGTAEGVAYREFRLDLNEQTGSTNPFLSLDALQIWQEEAGNLTNFTPGSGFAGAHTNSLVYNLDAGGNHWIGLNDSLSHGSGQSDVRILIPDSAFINDAAHRYVTLYSQFGVQSGWNSGGGFEEWSLNNDHTGPTDAIAVHKTATVPGGTANVAGEVISYAITVDNVGDTALTGITVTDPSVTNLAAVDLNHDGYNDGDTNHDNQLSAGESWQYTGSYTVTQSDIDTLGNGSGLIQNTVTADSAETAPVSASASVTVESGTSVDLTKTADVSSVDSAGDVITYTLTVANTGNTTLTSVQVDDSDVNIATPIIDPNAPVPGAALLAQVLNGDYNVGDTNQNGFQDPGETFHFVNAGDINQNGVQDSGETFLFTNIGDTNQNGFEDTGEHFQYYNVGDTNHNGVQDTDNPNTPGDESETFQFNVDHSATPVLGVGGFNVGDDGNGILDPGETWQYTVSYTVTQNDIDNGGVVQPGLTHDDTATVLAGPVTDSDTHSVTIVQDPRVAVAKTATVLDGSANAVGDEIDYTISVSNAGNMTLTNPVVSDPKVSNLSSPSGDDGNGKLDVGETWTYTAKHIVTQADIDNAGIFNAALTYNNTASVATDQGTQTPNGDPDANASASASVPIVQNPHVTLDKTATVADLTADSVGDVINYTINVTNDGNMTLANPVVSDPSVSDLTRIADALGGNNDNILDVGETWQYTAKHTVTQADIDNGGVFNSALAYTNTASVTTVQTTADPRPDPTATDIASVPIVQNPHVTLDKTATVGDLTADSVGDVINYTINVTNDGNMTLTNPVVSDPLVSNLTRVADLVGNGDNILNVGETWQYTATHAVTQADIDNGGTVDSGLTYDNTATVTTDQTTADPRPDPTATDSASVPIVQNPHVTLDKTATVPGGTADTAGEVISYAIGVHNDGNMTLTGVLVDDPSATGLTRIADVLGGNNDNILDVGETWQYTASHTVTQDELDSNNGGTGVIQNTASISTDQGASSSDSAPVTVVATPPLTYSMTLEKTAFGYHDVDSSGTANAGDTLVYHFVVHNTGTGTQTGLQVGDTNAAVAIASPTLASLAPGDDYTWTGDYTITPTDVSSGVDNSAFVNSDFGNAVTGNVHTAIDNNLMMV